MHPRVQNRPPSRLVIAIPLGLAISIGIGLLAGGLWDGDFWVSAIVFAAATLVPSIALVTVLMRPATADEALDEQPDNVEYSWAQQIGNRVFLDLMIVLGLACLVLAVTSWDVRAVDVLAGITGVAMADYAIRWALTARRER